MHTLTSLFIISLPVQCAYAQHGYGGYPEDTLGLDTDGKYHISAPGIHATFVPYGASLSNLFLTRDTRSSSDSDPLDIVLGWDNASYYTTDTLQPYFNSIPGRYANRIRNGTFMLDGTTHHTPLNEHNRTTLHGGPHGWAKRNWTLVAHTPSSITFALADGDGEQGFPGSVAAQVTYSVSPWTWHVRMTAVPSKHTPLMLSSHTYLNLDGFLGPAEGAAGHVLGLPFSKRRVGVDDTLVPTGSLLGNDEMYDFREGKKIGLGWQEGSNGYDTCFLVEREEGYDWNDAPVATLASAWSEIRLDLFSDQQALQVYSCNGMNGSVVSLLSVLYLQQCSSLSVKAIHTDMRSR